MLEDDSFRALVNVSVLDHKFSSEDRPVTLQLRICEQLGINSNLKACLKIMLNYSQNTVFLSSLWSFYLLVLPTQSNGALQLQILILTGGTIESCAKALQLAGAAEVMAFAVAKPPV